MRKLHMWAAAAVLGAVVAVLAFAAPRAGQAGPADKDKPAAKDKPKEKPTTLQGRIAADTKLSEEDVDKVLAALGPAIRDDRGSRRQSGTAGPRRLPRRSDSRTTATS